MGCQVIAVDVENCSLQLIYRRPPCRCFYESYETPSGKSSGTGVLGAVGLLGWLCGSPEPGSKLCRRKVNS